MDVVCGGNEAFWDWLARNGYGTIDLLQVIDSAKRSDRFQRAGMVTEPGAVPPTEEETAKAYGVRYMIACARTDLCQTPMSMATPVVL